MQIKGIPTARRRRLIGAVLAAGLLGGAGTAHAAGEVKPIRPLGTVDFGKVASQAGRVTPNHQIRNAVAFQRLREREDARFEGSGLRPFAPPARPNVAGFPVTVDPIEQGFEGEDVRDTVFTNGFEVEPPDQGLCGGTYEGTTYLFDSVNLSIALYDTTGSKDTPSVSLNDFYNLPPLFNTSTGKYGPFLSDPKCLFDVQTGRWFHTVLELGLDPDTGDFDGTANTLIAASTSTDPLGPYNLYAVDAANASREGCPCLGDQPLLGADANGLFVSTAEYGLFTSAFHGAQIYAFDKRALSDGTANSFVYLEGNTQKTGTLQPATSPTDAYDSSQNGTEYFMAAFDCEIPDCSVDADSVENTIQLSSLTNTQSLRTSTPDLHFFTKILDSQTYAQPVPQEQKLGYHPFGEAMGEPVPEVEANDARMNQVVYARGRLWAGLNTSVDPGPRDGLAWFQVKPTSLANGVRGGIVRQGYVATSDRDGFLAFPSVGVNAAGRGVIAYTLMGAKYHPSSAWTAISRAGTSGGVRVAELGNRAEDGFTCYPVEESECRWGDYTASFALPNGTIWSATEFIGRRRTTYANWDTFIWPVKR